MLAAAIARRLTPDDGAATTPGPQRPVDAWTTLGDFERLNVRPCRPYFVRSLATSIPDFNCICVPKISGAQHQPDQRAQRDGEQVRVVEYQLDDGTSDPEQRYRLLTTIHEPEHAPAAELGVLYHERWEIENALDELKVHQRGPRVVLRSKQPDGVYQEAYGYLCTHYAIRRLMHDAALHGDLDPDRLSFTRSLRAARRSARTKPGFSPPDDRHRP